MNRKMMSESSESAMYKGFKIYASKPNYQLAWIYHVVPPSELPESFPVIERTWAGHSGAEAIAYAKNEIDQKIGDRIAGLREELVFLEKIKNIGEIYA